MSNLLKSTNKRFLIIGDLMLDKYEIGSVSRISPEAPTMIVKKIKTEYALGGGANVSNILRSLSDNIYLCGIIGKDPDGLILNSLLTELDIDTSLIVSSSHYTTIVKNRIIDEESNQYLLRIDTEEAYYAENKLVNYLLEKIIELLPSIHGVVISDYNKGLLTEYFMCNLVKQCNMFGIPTIADVKGMDLQKYKDVTIIKPNENELRELVHFQMNSINDIYRALKLIKDKTNAKHILLTRGKKGMILYSNENEILHIPSIIQKNIIDVIGAGDTVLAYLSYCYVVGKDIHECANISNIAASIQLTQRGTHCIRIDDVNRYLLSDNLHKIITVDDFVELGINSNNIVFTNGCFDILHLGHIKFLKQCSKLNKTLVVGVNSDASVKKIKGEKRPINSEFYRMEVLANFDNIDYIIKFDEATPNNVIKKIQPSIIAKGGDYKIEDVCGKAYVEQYGGKVVIIPYVGDYSTTNVVQYIKNL